MCSLFVHIEIPVDSGFVTPKGESRIA